MPKGKRTIKGERGEKKPRPVFNRNTVFLGCARTRAVVEKGKDHLHRVNKGGRFQHGKKHKKKSGKTRDRHGRDQ